jgi:hypothetical protein
MRFSPRLRAAGCVLGIAATGCTAMQEIPPKQITARPERQNVRVVTNEGLEYEFDFARFSGDSLVGYRRRPLPGKVEQYDTLPIALADVRQVSARAVDWKRTGLIGVAVVAIGVAVGLHVAQNGDSGGDTSGGGGGIRPPE